jgi:hypothetical protein
MTPSTKEQIVKDFVKLVWPWAVTARINRGMFYIYSGEPLYQFGWCRLAHRSEYIYRVSNALGLDILTEEEEKNWRMDF